MNRKLVFVTVCKQLLIAVALLAICMIVSLIYKDGCTLAFLESIAVLCAVAVPVVVFVKPQTTTLYFREAVAVAGLDWLFLSLFACLPLVFSKVCSFADAYFEIASGFTTTGATVFSNVDELPESINFLRCFSHWVGGVGVLVLATAVVPSSDNTSARLTRAESTGPSYSKLMPKSGDNSKTLYIIYGSITLALIIALRLCGMNLFDSIIHGLSTAGTGGFSNRSTSIGYYNSAAVEIVIGVFMLLFGISFGVYFKLISKDYKTAFKNEELIVYIAITLVSVFAIAMNINPSVKNFGLSLRQSFFQVTSISSTTGFCTADFDLWPNLSKAILVLLMFIGSCAGSTAGGLKVIRIILLCKLACREINKSYAPRQIRAVRLDGKSVQEDMLHRVSVYFFIFMFTLIVGTFCLVLSGCDILSSFTGSLACVSNIGPGLAMLGPTANFGFLPAASKIIMAIVMIAGRLEFFPIFMLILPSAWRK